MFMESEINGQQTNEMEAPTHLLCGDDEKVEISGYKINTFKRAFSWICIFVTFGFLQLVFYWKPDWMIYFTHTKCGLKDATSILLVDQYKKISVSKVIRQKSENIIENQSGLEKSVGSSLLLPKDCGAFESVSFIQYFKYKKIKYIWHEFCDGSRYYKELSSIGSTLSCKFFHNQKGLSEDDRLRRRELFGKNEIGVPVYSILKLLFREVLNPFYVFQVFSVSLWFADEYEQYASAIVIISAISISISIYQLHKNQVALRDTVHLLGIITVVRENGECVTVSSDEVVPGDVIVVPSNSNVMLCDAVLLSGNCIVNEASLTGESVPVTKTALPNYSNTQFDVSTHARHTLFCGTTVIQTRYYGDEKVKAVVIKTGFTTQKGQLVRSILYPKPVDFKFNEDAVKFIMFLGLIAIGGFIYTVVIMHRNGEDISSIVKKALDLITITVPPALPAAMTVGIIYAQHRLKKGGIFCISPRFINISGSIDCVCFDKTGTLTEEGLDVLGVLPSRDGMFGCMVQEIDKLTLSNLIKCMASCHSLTIIEQEICGDPLDLKMFESSGWEIEEPEIDDSNKFDVITPTIVHPNKKQMSENTDDDSKVEIGIIRQFTFSSSLQRMSVITRSVTGKRFELYAKGSPEMIASLCVPSSIPDNFNEMLQKYTIKGYRVIALGHRKLHKMKYTKVQRVTRSEVECDLTFLGLLVMENRLKAETKGTIDVLHDANIKTVMITGDNILTAICVARECGIIKAGEICLEVASCKKSDDDLRPLLKLSDISSHGTDDISITKESLNFTLSANVSKKVKLAISGKTFDTAQQHYPELLPKLFKQSAVFARMSPDQKQFIIENMQKLGQHVAMCGDGANDCGALKSAHAGISLSEAEASIASPFTSKNTNISCVPDLIREGRAALVTAFGMFKYMALYSMCQFTTVLFLYSLRSNLTDWEFIYIDLILITTLAGLFGRTEAYKKLSKRPPPLSLIDATPIISLLIHIVLIIVFQVIAYYFTTVQPWYLPHSPNKNAEDEDLASFDNFSIFSISLFQYIGTSIIFSKGAPYRKSIFTNKLFLLLVFLLTGLSIYLVLYPSHYIIELFELKLTPSISFRAMLLLIAAANFILSFLAEFFIIDFILSKRLKLDQRRFFRKKIDEYDKLELQSETNSPNPASLSPPTVLSPLSLDSPSSIASKGSVNAAFYPEDSMPSGVVVQPTLSSPSINIRVGDT